MEEKETFTYTYSAARQEEVAAIRRKYAPVPEKKDKMSQLRQLDAAVNRKAAAAALLVGVVSALVMGLGMSLVMTELGAALGLTAPLLPGILIGIPGMAGVIAAYPLHRRILKRERAKAAPRILQLAEELSQ